jgi:cholesterol transport system auxiliary component
VSRARSLMVALALAAASGGCALTDKADPLEIRYFAPEPPPRAQPVADGAGSRDRLRLGRWTASDHLRNRIVYRTSDVELGMYADRRWTERPEIYVRRAFSRELFEDRGLVQVVGGAGPVLDVELLAFEEVRRAGKRTALVEVHFALRSEAEVLTAGTLTAEKPVAAGEGTEAVVAALSIALGEVAEALADRVQTQLAQRDPPPPAAPALTEASR